MSTPTTARRPVRDVPVPPGFDMVPLISSVLSGLAGPANVIMQLSWPGIGYAVMNSTVHDGSAMRHPVKRTRTTFTYLAVAMLGTDDDRTAYRQAVNRQHAQVVKTEATPDEPVEYRAMDPRLQTWVAACLYYGTADITEKVFGRQPDDVADALYAHCARFGTTLQMPASAWPADRTAFEAYWQESLAEVRIDPPVRDYLLDLTAMRGVLPRRLRRVGDWLVFVSTGFLPPEFREAMQLEWSGADQRRFDRLVRRVARVDRALPPAVRAAPFRLLLADMRWRKRLGRRLV